MKIYECDLPAWLLRAVAGEGMAFFCVSCIIQSSEMGDAVVEKIRVLSKR